MLRHDQDRDAGTAMATNQWPSYVIRDDIRAFILEHMHDPHSALIIDKPGFFRKRMEED
jgi:hypothetical protein